MFSFYPYNSRNGSKNVYNPGDVCRRKLSDPWLTSLFNLLSTGLVYNIPSNLNNLILA